VWTHNIIIFIVLFLLHFVHDSHALQKYAIPEPLRHDTSASYLSYNSVQCAYIVHEEVIYYIAYCMITYMIFLRLVRRALRIYKNGWREKKIVLVNIIASRWPPYFYIRIRSRISLHKCTGNDYISVSATPWNSLNGTVYGYIARIYLYCRDSGTITRTYNIIHYICHKTTWPKDGKILYL